jgi:predicted enzyme related to lactoylglutathione lyase
MIIELSSVLVNDQKKAFKFYTEVLGFKKKIDLPMGEHRWMTVTSPDGHSDVELLLEPIAFGPAETYQKEVYNATIPATAFRVADLHAEIERLRALNVKIETEPMQLEGLKLAVIDDTCGNLIQLYEKI